VIRDAGRTTTVRRASCTSLDLPLSVRLPRPERRRGVSTRAREFGEHHCFRGPATIAAVILETIPGRRASWSRRRGISQGVRELCDRHGIVYIADEVMCGFGRTGSWFAYQQHGVKPDLVTFAKGVNSGYVPLGGVVINEAISATFNDRVYPGVSPTQATRWPAPPPCLNRGDGTRWHHRKRASRG